MTLLDSKTSGRKILRFLTDNGLILGIVGLVLAIDQGTKHWAVTQLDDGRVVHVVWTLQFNLAFNSGMAFGRGQGWGPIIGVITLLVVVGLVLSIRRHDDTRVSVGVGLVVAGAVGNIVDRLFRGDGWLHGSVVDFIDFQWFPIFNVADIAVNVGGALLVWTYLRGPRVVERA